MNTFSQDVGALLESERYPALNESEKMVLGKLLENATNAQDQELNESTVSQDIATFTPILLP